MAEMYVIDNHYLLYDPILNSLNDLSLGTTVFFASEYLGFQPTHTHTLTYINIADNRIVSGELQLIHLI